jgi:imidazolonepropionase-like amidohydrolase
VLVEKRAFCRGAASGRILRLRWTKIDIAGMTLMPGLIDCHVHLSLGAEPRGAITIFHQCSASELALRSLENAQATLRGGITSARDCGDREYNSLIARDAINAGRHLGPTLRCRLDLLAA